jgi:hypothetical protein
MVLSVGRAAAGPLRRLSERFLLSPTKAPEDENRSSLALPDHMADLSNVLTEALAQNHPDIAELQVHLGLRHCRLGVLRMTPQSVRSFAASPSDIIAAWMKQAWNLDAQDFIVRWTNNRGASDITLSCVDRQVFAQLQSFATSRRYRFTVCAPAILDALNPAADNGDEVVVWTEFGSSAARAEVVQILAIRDGNVRLYWRGWVPTQGDAEGRMLAQQVNRFVAMHGVEDSVPIRQVHWQPGEALVPA